MAYLAPIHHASSIRHALKLNFLAPDEQNVVVAKSNRLEVYEHAPDGLVLKHSRTVYGRITMLQKLRPAASKTDHLFVGTDRYMYFTASWDPAKKQLKTEKSYVDQRDPFGRDSQTGDRCNVDASRSFMTIESYEGVVVVVPFAKQGKKASDLEPGTLGVPTPVRIPEMLVRDSTFFETKLQEKNAKPKIALLHQDPYRHVKLRVREVDYSPGLSSDGPSVDLDEVSGFEQPLEIGTSHLIPVKSPVGGLIVLGETSITYFEQSSNQSLRRPLQAATIFVAWEQIDDERYIFADEYGKLYLFMLDIDERKNVVGWRLDVLGETSKASALVYLGEGKVFVASHQGDSQVVLIQPQAIQILQTLPNIAPILDFRIMDLGNRTSEAQVNDFSSGQARVVTGSGAFTDGSLRSVRSGVSLEDQGVLDEMRYIERLFSVSSTAATSTVDTLIVSFASHTRVFCFSPDGNIEEVDDFKSMLLGEATLYAANVGADRLLQSTASALRLIDRESGMVLNEWKPPSDKAILSVSCSDEKALVSFGGVHLVALELQKDLSVVAERTFDNEIACINVDLSGKSLCAAAFWNTCSMSILSMQDLTTKHSTSEPSDKSVIPRDVLIADILEGQPPTVLLSMADGQVITYSLDRATGAVSNEKSIVLGVQRANLHSLPRSDGLFNVFATSEQSSLIYGSEGRMTYSAVTAEAAVSVCPFNSVTYPHAIAVATESDLRISLIDEERSTHVQGTHFGETVRRIARSPGTKTFGLGTVKRTLEDGAEIVQSYFHLVDEVTFQKKATFELRPDELVECVMRADLPGGYGKSEERFVIGTAFMDPDVSEAVRGRIIILEPTLDGRLKQSAEIDTKGACRCLGMAGGMIVAALIKTVVLYSLEYPQASSAIINKVASYRTATAPIDIDISQDAQSRPIIAVADLMKSLTILRIEPPATPGAPSRLVEIGRHIATLWATACCRVDDSTYLQADGENNLVVLRQDLAGVTDEDRRRLTPTSELHLGELVNRIRRIDVPAPPASPVVPRAFLATTEGALFLFALIRDDWQDRLMRLQGALAGAVSALGGLPFASWRAWRTLVREEAEPFRFVDGELVEAFLDVGEDVQTAVLKEAGLLDSIGLEKMRAVVEGLRRLR